jgi:hypothetical protein
MAEQVDVAASGDPLEEAAGHRLAAIGQARRRDPLGRLGDQIREVEHDPAQPRPALQQPHEQHAGAADLRHALGASPGLVGQHLGDRGASRHRQAVEPRARRGIAGQALLPDRPIHQVEGGLTGLDHAPGRAHRRVGVLADRHGQGA